MAEASAGSVASTGTNAAAAPQSVADSQTTSDPAFSPAKQQTQAPIDNDPEEDWGEGIGKVKRSKVKDIITKRRDFDRAAHQRFEEAAKMRRENETRDSDYAKLEARAKKGDKGAIWELAQKLGLDPDELAENRLASALERSRMTPEQLEMEEIRAENKRLKEANEQTEAQQKQDYQEQLTGQWVQQFDRLIGPAMSSVKLPKTPHSVARMAAVIEQFIAKGQPIDAEWAAQVVQQEQRATIRESLDAAEDDATLLDLLGERTVARINKLQLARATGGVIPPQKNDKPRQAPKPKQPPTFEDVRKQLRMGS